TSPMMSSGANGPCSRGTMTLRACTASTVPDRRATETGATGSGGEESAVSGGPPEHPTPNVNASAAAHNGRQLRRRLLPCSRAFVPLDMTVNSSIAVGPLVRRTVRTGGLRVFDPDVRLFVPTQVMAGLR